jgi:hypothetical protein
MAKNLCGKTREAHSPYEVWENASGWRWVVLKKWQADDDKEGARWFCQVSSPFTPDGYPDLGDVYVSEIKQNAVCVYKDPSIAAA